MFEKGKEQQWDGRKMEGKKKKKREDGRWRQKKNNEGRRKAE